MAKNTDPKVREAQLRKAVGKEKAAAILEAPKRIGRPPKEPKTVEQRLDSLESKYYKWNTRLNDVEDTILVMGEAVQKLKEAASTVKDTQETVDPEYSNRLEQMDENIVQIKEMLFQLCDSLGEEESE
jgi:hypothetical protein